MDTTAPLTVSEWEWFKLQLRLYALERRAPMWAVGFSFRDENDGVGFQDIDACVKCYIHNGRIDDVLEEVKNKNQLIEEYFDGWVASMKKTLGQILAKLPVLNRDIDIEKDIVFEIMQDYGMGASRICRITGKEILWGILPDHLKDQGDRDKQH